SLYGYMASAMLTGPRLTFAFAERGDFPAWFAGVHPRFHTPHVSITVFASLVLALAVAGGFEQNATLSAVVRLFTYGLVCLALLRLRKTRTEAPAFRLPAAPAVAAVGIVFCMVVGSRMGMAEVKIVGATAALAVANWLWVRGRPNA
ncbi:MAG: amino acid permease, partial [Acidobacteria bacterium]|nr:amino acid permease [Acidobacteriota bacterium]